MSMTVPSDQDQPDGARDRYTPRITVAAVVACQQRFLMVEEWVNELAVFNQPAGHLEPGESLLEALRRETLEESGCVIEPLHLISIYHTDALQPDKAKLRFNFAARLLEQRHGAQLDSGIIAAHWLTLEQLQRQRARLRGPVVLSCIEDYQTGVRLPLSAMQTVRT